MRRLIALILVTLIAASATAVAWESIRILEFNSRLLDGKSAASPFYGGILLAPDGNKGYALADEVSQGLSEIIAQTPDMSFGEPPVFDRAALEMQFTEGFEALSSGGFDATFTDRDLSQSLKAMEGALTSLQQLSFGDSVDLSSSASQMWSARLRSGYSEILAGGGQAAPGRP